MADILAAVIDNLSSLKVGGLTEAEQAAANVASDIISGSPELILNFIRQRQLLWAKFWQTNGIHPQLIANVLNTEAKSIFSRDAQFVAFIAGMLKASGATDAAIAEALPGVPSTYTVTLNDDGTATIADVV
jgi:hypothetical protein